MTGSDPSDEVAALRERLEAGKRGESTADREALLEASDNIDLVPSQIGPYRHRDILRHGARISEKVGGLAAALEDRLAAEISDAVGIRLEYEANYDWLCFVPKREKASGALTKYFGKVAGEDAYKVRGIEVRQRSTPAFIESVQRELMEVLGTYREPESVCDRLQIHLSRLRGGDVDPANLVFRNRASKGIDEYRQGTYVVSALKRFERAGIEKGPGQDVQYVVVDDGARLAERVRLPFEEIEEYDAEIYSRELVRAAESIVSPLGWEREDVRRHLRETTDATLHAYE